MSRRLLETAADQTSLFSSILPVMTDLEQIQELRRLLSGFSHRCRNSLNGMKMSLYLFRREAREEIPPNWHELERTYQQIEILFDQLQTIYRPMALTMVRAPLDRFIGDRAPKWQSCFQMRGRTFQLDPPEHELVGDFDPIQLGIGLDALAAWRGQSADSIVNTSLGWRTHDGDFEICWEEHHACGPPGPSLSNGGEEFPPDLDATSPLHSLVLPLLARILGAHGGRVEATGESVLNLKLLWPRFQSVA